MTHDTGQLVIRNARVITPSSVIDGGVLAANGRIRAVFTAAEEPVGIGAATRIDLHGDLLSPGLVDIHVHGSTGVDLMDAGEDALATLSNFLMSRGVTSYLATLAPAEEDAFTRTLASLSSYIALQGSRVTHCARMLGAHFEGPFLNANRAGALRRECFREYDGDARSLDRFALRTEHASVMTVAPETVGGLDLIRELRRRDFKVFIGHSEAEPETLDRAVECGARHVTHFPNALRPLHHRQPGAVAWGLVRGDVTLDCIADLHHVHPLMLKLMYQAKGPDRLALISDAISPAGLGDGTFDVWGEKITVKDQRTSLLRAEGTLAGSAITLLGSVKNVLSIGVPLVEAIRMASLTPARAAGLDLHVGSIESGKIADLVAFDDNLEISQTFIGGVAASHV